ncbi:hypothetical protein [Leptolyngbya sp. FACHB-261]|uniref:hypothetical protein n=1 Tax=Leptolyngbya sp. FACHB-261 TaxID=2692806 RepID=UPI001683C81E|nr:hypothetical protein [Leptolyngbya sp. FACHB-261]MBD2101558.1 hypothetical protein [Leptolyngbya sp. FACHB-261]
MQNTSFDIATNTSNLLSGLKQRTIDTATDITTYAHTISSKTANGAVAAFNGTAHKAASTVTEVTHQAAINIGETAVKARTALEPALQNAGTPLQKLAEPTQNFMAASLQSWAKSHPHIGWTMSHSIWTIAIFLGSIFLLWGLSKALANLSERIWLSVLGFPFKIGQHFFSSSLSRRSQANISELKELNPISLDKEAREKLASILVQLEKTRQEQDQLLQELASTLTR